MYAIYCIKNKHNGKVYVGSTVDFKKRIWKHFSMLRRGNHRNRKLQKDFIRYGGRCSFEVYKLCEAKSKENALKFEQIFIDGFTDTYNILPKAGSAKNRVYMKKTLDKMSKTAKAKGQAPPRTTKLTENDVFEILSMASSGVSRKDLREKFGVSKNTIRLIIIGQTWNHVYKKYHEAEAV